MLPSCMDFLEVNRRENCVYYNVRGNAGDSAVESAVLKGKHLEKRM